MSESALGTCDKRQYEHSGPHVEIMDYGQPMPPFPCSNWKVAPATPAEEVRPEQAASLIAKRLYPGSQVQQTIASEMWASCELSTFAGAAIYELLAAMQSLAQKDARIAELEAALAAEKARHEVTQKALERLSMSIITKAGRLGEARGYGKSTIGGSNG